MNAGNTRTPCVTGRWGAGDVLTFGGAKSADIGGSPRETAKKSIYTYIFHRHPAPGATAAGEAVSVAESVGTKTAHQQPAAAMQREPHQYASPAESSCNSTDDPGPGAGADTVRHGARGEAAANIPLPPPLAPAASNTAQHPVLQRPVNPMSDPQDRTNAHVHSACAQRPSVEVRLEAGVPCGKLYPDLRHAFVAQLWSRAIGLRCAADQKSSLDATVRAILAVALHPYPLRSADAALSLAGIGDELCDCLRQVHGASLEGQEDESAEDREAYREDLRSHGSSHSRGRESGNQGRGVERAGAAGVSRRGPASNPPPAGKYASAAEACLVALLEFAEERERLGELGLGRTGGGSRGCGGGCGGGRTEHCTLEELLVLADARLSAGERRRLNMPSDYYLSPEVTDIGWLQMKKLCSAHDLAGLPQMVKERSSKKACASGAVFELLEAGRGMAQRIRAASTTRVSPGVCVCARARARACACACVCTCVCVCVCVCVCIHIYVSVCVCVCIHICIHICIHSCIHMYGQYSVR